jgi:hypothetical protein
VLNINAWYFSLGDIFDQSKRDLKSLGLATVSEADFKLLGLGTTSPPTGESDSRFPHPHNTKAKISQKKCMISMWFGFKHDAGPPKLLNILAGTAISEVNIEHAIKRVIRINGACFIDQIPMFLNYTVRCGASNRFQAMPYI